MKKEKSLSGNRPLAAAYIGSWPLQPLQLQAKRQ